MGSMVKEDETLGFGEGPGIGPLSTAPTPSEEVDTITLCDINFGQGTTSGKGQGKPALEEDTGQGAGDRRSSEIGQGMAPDFVATAHGSPADWNNTLTLSWGKRARPKFPEPPPASNVSISLMLDFLQKRTTKEGAPVRQLLGPPVPQDEGWYRLEWTQLGSMAEGSLEAEGWEHAWHGCKLEGLYSILYHGRLAESRSRERGEQHLDGAPRVCMYKDSTRSKAEAHVRFLDLCGDGIFWASMIEVRVDRSSRVIVPRQTDQWAQKAHRVQIAALWLCSRIGADFKLGSPVAEKWDPELKADPASKAWKRRSEEDDQAPQGGAGTHQDRAARRLALAAEAPYLEYHMCLTSGGDYQELWCTLCGKWANGSHLQSTKHILRARQGQAEQRNTREGEH
jgi:hypothetical protein